MKNKLIFEKMQCVDGRTYMGIKDESVQTIGKENSGQKETVEFKERAIARVFTWIGGLCVGGGGAGRCFSNRK